MTPVPCERGSSTRRLVSGLLGAWAASMTAAAVAAAAVGTWVFHSRLVQWAPSGQTYSAAAAEAAFRAAGLHALAAAVVAGLLVALAVGARRARTLGTALDRLTTGADLLSAGHYDRPVATPLGWREIEPVAHTINDMADTIAGIENRRRRMLTDLSHEMRTPVAAIDVTLEAIADGLVELDDTALAALHAQTRRLTRLAGDITEVSAAEEGRLALNRTTVTVDTLVSSAALSAANAYELGEVTLLVGPPMPGVQVYADPGRIGQVLDNLLRNAVQHTPRGGRVTISATYESARDNDEQAAGEAEPSPSRDETRRAAHSGTPGTVAITVTDNGVGIAAEHLPHVFERFYRANPGRPRDKDSGAGSGTGVGLAISRGIAASHGGTLTGHSDGPGTGARFTLRLPRHRP